MTADPLAVLQKLLDAKAKRGEAFTRDEAELDTRAMGMSLRKRADRWGWSLSSVRTLERGGEPDLEGRFANKAAGRGDTGAAQGNTEATQETALTAQNGGEATQGSHKGDTGAAPTAPLSLYSPPSPTGTAPPGGPNESGVEDQIRRMQAEAERLGAERAMLEAQAEAAEAERKRLAAAKRRGSTRFTPPTVAEVRAFGARKGAEDERYGPDHAEDFVGYFTSNGWRVGKGGVPMKDWQAAYLGWCRRAPKLEAQGRRFKPLNLSGALSQRDKDRAIAEYGMAEDDFYRSGTDPRGEPEFKTKPGVTPPTSPF